MSIKHITYFTAVVITLFSCAQKLSPPEPLEISNEIIIPTKAIMIESATSNIGPCEPTICINPNNSQHIVAGAILDKIYVSRDGGLTWSIDRLSSSYGVYGDPVIRANYKGDFFYSHLSNPSGQAYLSEDFLDRIVIQKSEDGGVTWSDGSYTLPRSPKDQDKQWLTCDPRDNTMYITWTEFDLYDSPDPDDHSRILFSRSEDDGDTWTDPIVLSQFEGDCIDSDNTTEGAVPDVGPEGQVYVAWAYNEKIYFDKSFDKGETWLDEDILVANQPGGWDIKIPGLSRANGMPITRVDRTNGPNKGAIYINWSDQRNGTHDTDIWLTKSTDQGKTWSVPNKVNNDAPGKQQFLSWMDIDQTTGYIHIVFYDRREHDNNATDVYVATSKDGGKTFDNIKVNNESFIPTPEIFFGDYNDISSVNGQVRPIWTELNGRTLSVWTAVLESR